MCVIHPTGKALPHMRCRLVSLTLSAAVSPACIPTNLSRSLMRIWFNASTGTLDPVSRQSCQVIGEILGWSRALCLSGGSEVQHNRTRDWAQ
eukprot:scaffold1580_cov495-Pavlova_lutheri.AAC.2